MKNAVAWLYITPGEADRLVDLQDYEEPEIEAFGGQVIRLRSADGLFDIPGPAAGQRLSNHILRLEFRDGTTRRPFDWQALFAGGVPGTFFRWNADSIEEFRIVELVDEGEAVDITNGFLEA